MEIEFIKTKLLVKYPFLWSIVVNCVCIEDRVVKNICTSGKKIYYNPDFIGSITDDEQVFVFAHSIFHIVFNHELRGKGKDIELWGIATDAVVNALLNQDGFSIPLGAVYIPGAENYDADGMYEKLLEEKKSGSWIHNEQKNQNGFFISKIDEKVHCDYDDHSSWNRTSKSKNVNDLESEKMIKLGERESFRKNKTYHKKQLKELRDSLIGQSSGCDTSKEKSKVNNIGIAKPFIDWRGVLKDSIRYVFDWSFRNATIEDGAVSAHLDKLETPEVEIGIDISGSVSLELIRIFLRECKNILRISKIKVGFFDVCFYGFNEIRCEDDIDNLEIPRGGGTDFNAVVNAFSGSVKNRIIFTDGAGGMPDKSLDAIWVVFGDDEINPIGGKVIYVDDEQIIDNYVKKKTLY